MYNYPEQTKAMPPLAVGMSDQRKTQYQQGYHAHPETHAMSRAQLVPGSIQPKMTLSSMAYPASQGHTQPMTTQTNAVYFYGTNPSEASSRYSRSHAGHAGSVSSQNIPVNSSVTAEGHKNTAHYGSGSIQNGLPANRPDRVPRIASGGYPRTAQETSLGLSGQAPHAGSVNAGLIVSYPNSVQSGISQSASQNRSGSTGVFKIHNPPTEYRQSGLDAKNPVSLEKQSPVSSSRAGSMYQGSLPVGYPQGSSIPQSPKQNGYPHSSAVTPSSQTMKMTLPGQPSSVPSGIHSMNRHSSIRQGYTGHSNQYGPLQSPTGSQHRQVISGSAYGTQRPSVSASYHQSSSSSSESLRRTNQMSNTVPHHSYNQTANQRTAMSASAAVMDKCHPGYSIPVSSSSSARSQSATHVSAVRGHEYPPRRTENKDFLKPVMKIGSIQSGMPLDLTSADTSNNNRAAESPLDLSVKTRKRCADTTNDYGPSETESRNAPPMKKQCVKTDSPVDLRSKEYGKVMTAMTVPQPQKYTYDVERHPKYDIKIQQNMYPNSAYVNSKYEPHPSQRLAPPKSDITQSKSENIQNRYYSPHEASISQIQNYQNQASVKSPVMIQAKYDEHKVCYPSPPEVTAYPNAVAQKSPAPQLHVSSQSSVYSKVSYLDTSEYRRSMGYGQTSSPTVRTKNDIQTTNSYQRPVTSYVTSHSNQQRIPGGPQSSVGSSANSNANASYKQQHMYPSLQHQQMLQQQQQQQKIMHQQQLSQQQSASAHQQHQRPHPSQYYSQGGSKIVPSAQSSLPPAQYTQSTTVSKSVYQTPKRDTHAHAYENRCHDNTRSQPVTSVSQTVPSLEMKLPSSSGYMVATPERKNVNKPQVVPNRMMKQTVAEQHDVQSIPRPSSSHSTPEIQITAVTAPPGDKAQTKTPENQNSKEQVDIAKFTEPLHIAIPTPTSNSEQKMTTSTVQSTSSHKILSKKHRILNALSQEADQKRIATHISPMSQLLQHKVDGTFKVPTVSPSSPASPKMPILSPHDKIPPPADASLHNEPPQLDPPATPVKRLPFGAAAARGDNSQRVQQSDKGGKEKDNSKTATKAPTSTGHAEAVVDSPVRAGDKYVRPEIIRRNSLPVRPSMYQKNIPVANVAPFVHSNKDQFGPDSETSQLVAEEQFDGESSSSNGDNDDKSLSATRTETKQRKTPTTKRQKKDTTKAPQKKSSQFLAAPLKHKLLKFHQMEQETIARSFRKAGLRPRQKPVPVKKAAKTKRKTVRVTKKQKQEKAEDSEGFEVTKPLRDEEPTLTEKEPQTTARPDRTLRRAIIKIDRIEDSADRRLKLDQPASPTRRTVSNLSKRAQELKRKAIDGPRRRGRRRATQYNRNAAYEKELRKDESRRALNRAKRRARMRRVTRQDAAYPEEDEYDDDDDDTDGCWEISRTTSSQRQTPGSGRGKGGLMLKLFYRTGQETTPSRGRRARHLQDGSSRAGMIGIPRKATRGKARARGKMKARGKFQSQFEQFLKQDMETESDFLDDSYENFYMEEDATTYQVHSDDVEGGVMLYPIPPEMKKLAINKNSGETILHRAARLGYEEVALYCIRTHSVEVNARDNAGYTALHESCVKGNLNVARHLLEHGADVNCCSQDGIRPIHDAVENDHAEIVRLLLSYGADPTIATYGGKTPIKISHSFAMTTLLKGYLGDINGFDSENEETPWEFTGSSVVTDVLEGKGFDLFADVPSDPEDETEDLFDVEMTSAVRTYDLHLESADRLDRYVHVQDVMADFHLSRDDLKKICANKIQLHKISAKELCKSTDRNVLTFCQQTVSPVELMNFEDYKAVESKMVEHLKTCDEVNKHRKAKPKKRPSTPSKKPKRRRQPESSDNESDATIEFGSLFNSDDDSVDYTESVYSFEDEQDTQEAEPKKVTKSKHELNVHLKKENVLRHETKTRRKSNDSAKCDSITPGKSEVRQQSKPNVVYTSKSEPNVVFKTKTSISKAKSDSSSSGRGNHASKTKLRESASFDATMASKKAQSEHIYSFDEHDTCSNDDDPEITFPRKDRHFPERGEKHALRKERSVDCKKGLEKSFRTIMSNSKEDHFRFKIGPVSQESHENLRGSHIGSDTCETVTGSHNQFLS